MVSPATHADWLDLTVEDPPLEEVLGDLFARTGE